MRPERLTGQDAAPETALGQRAIEGYGHQPAPPPRRFLDANHSTGDAPALVVLPQRQLDRSGGERIRPGLQQRPAAAQIHGLHRRERLARSAGDLGPGRGFHRKAHRLAPLGVMDDDAVLPAALGLVQGLIGPVDERLAAGAVLGVDGQPPRDGHGHQPAFQRAVGEAGLDPAANPLGHRVGAETIGLGQDDRELVAPEAAGDVGFAHRPPDDLTGATQHQITEDVTVDVVHGLEEIEIEQQKRHGQGVAPAAADLDLQGALEVTAIEHRRQRVGHGAALGALQLRILHRPSDCAAAAARWTGSRSPPREDPDPAPARPRFASGAPRARRAGARPRPRSRSRWARRCRAAEQAGIPS